MTTLDNPSGAPDPSTVAMRPTAQRYGLIGALILIVVSLAVNLSGLVDYTQKGGTGNTIATILQYGIMITVIVLAIKTHRDDDLGGFITFGRGLGMGMLTALILGIITGIWAYVYFGLIDPGLIDQIREVAHDQALERGTTEEQLEQAEGIMNFFTSPVFFAVASLIGTLLVSFVTSLIASAVIKVEPPEQPV
ncbi:MAG: DUF4199 domain-containing protein [Saprospiraceae bacterium]